MLEDQPRLKLTGYRSAEEVDAVFGSSLVDVAYVVAVTPDALFVAADDTAWPLDQADYEWLCSAITGTLQQYGINGIVLSFLPRPNPPPDLAGNPT